MAVGALDSNGVYQYGEDDVASPFSTLLNKLAASISTQIGAWVAYTPTFSNFTLGNGSVSGKYKRIGRTVHYQFRATLGSTSSFTGLLIYGLPLPINGADGSAIYGTGRLGDASAGGIGPAAYAVAWTNNSLAAYLATTGLAVANGSPITWAAGDTFAFSGTYETTA